jgi:hypothetical protein
MQFARDYIPTDLSVLPFSTFSKRVTAKTHHAAAACLLLLLLPACCCLLLLLQQQKKAGNTQVVATSMHLFKQFDDAPTTIEVHFMILCFPLP